MSATLDEDLFWSYYDNARIIKVPGRTFQIEDEYAAEDPDDYVDAAIAKALEIHSSKQPGDILVFLTGPDEINRAIEEITEKVKPRGSALVLPLHGKLNEDEMQVVFKSTSSERRKIIFATNVAETSITIDGIRHVIDSGMVKEVMWNPQRNMRALKIGYTTQSSVQQRRGRAGRTAAGKCYHLYTLDTYKSLDVSPRAEILCIQPSIAVLKLKHLGVENDVSKFDWLQAPSSQSLQDAVHSLTLLGALDPNTGMLTDAGRTMAKLDIEPMLSVMILTGKRYDCLSHVLALAGMLNVAQNVWWRGKDDQSKQLGDEMRALFTQDSGSGGDHISLLRIFLEWDALGENRRSNRTWCREHMINGKSMKMADDFVREVAYQIDPKFEIKLTELNDDLIERIIRCVCAGFFQHLAISNGHLRAGYQLVSGSTNETFARVHRSSTLTFAQQSPKFVIYHDVLILNQTNYLTAVCPISLDWLNKPWLNSLPRSPSQCVLKSFTFESLGPALLLSLVGKKCQNVPSLEESLGVFVDADYKQSQLTIWGRSQKLDNAKLHFEPILNREREKLRTEVQEFEIIGKTRILLGAGAQAKLVMIGDEYVKILITRLPTDVTEEQIEEKCRLYGPVQNISVFQTNQSGSSAIVTYHTCDSARAAVIQLSHETWNGREINVNPSHIRTSVHAGRQNCKLKAQWFMTESACNGRVQFSQQEAAVQANEFFKQQKKFYSRIYPNTSNPTIKCSWPLVPHVGKGFVYFQTVEQVRQVLNSNNFSSFLPKMDQKNNYSVMIQNVPQDLDEYDLKTIFTGCTKVVLIRGDKRAKLTKPIGVEDDLRRLFNIYSSFQRELVFVIPEPNSGCLEAYVQFTNEGDMQAAINDMNDKSNLIGSGKLRLSIYEQQQAAIKLKNRKAEMKKYGFVIKLSKLPQDVDEEAIIQDLNRHQLGDYISDVFVARKKLPPISSTDELGMMTEENEINLLKLKSLFTNRDRFRSLPDIQIRPATNDGRVVAFILFDHPSDVITAMQIYEAPDDPNLLTFGKYKLRLVPIIDHDIELNSALARAIPSKIEHAIDMIKGDQTLSNITLIKKVAVKNEQEIIRISIKGTNIQHIYKARRIFDDLMKGLIFKFNNPSWVSVIFDTMGKKFLQELQERTGTYIWWNWKSTFLRIFGEDLASRKAYQEIEAYIQETLARYEHLVSIPIPEGCIRQCMQKSNELRELSNEKAKVTIHVIKRLISINGDRQTVFKCEQQVKDLLSKFVPVPVHPTAVAWQNITTTTTTKDICFLCMCDFDSPYSLQQCRHIFCRLCLMNYFETIFNTTVTADAFKLCCPLNICNAECLIRDIVSILGFDKAALLATIVFKIHIRRPENDLVQCMGNNCDQLYRPSKYSSTYFCDQCNEIYCIPCQVEYHIGITCEQYQQSKKQ